jgi:hypothetical protein
MTNTVVVSEDQITVVTAAAQGPRGPAGPMAPVLMGTVSLASANDMAVTLIASSRYAFTITDLHNLVVGSGSTTLTMTIDGVPVTGLASLAVTTSAQNPVATANNVVSVGSKLGLTLSGGTSATDFQFTMGATPN